MQLAKPDIFLHHVTLLKVKTIPTYQPTFFQPNIRLLEAKSMIEPLKRNVKLVDIVIIFSGSLSLECGLDSFTYHSLT